MINWRPIDKNISSLISLENGKEFEIFPAFMMNGFCCTETQRKLSHHPQVSGQALQDKSR
jgi:hypothetical protein